MGNSDINQYLKAHLELEKQKGLERRAEILRQLRENLGDKFLAEFLKAYSTSHDSLGELELQKRVYYPAKRWSSTEDLAWTYFMLQPPPPEGMIKPVLHQTADALNLKPRHEALKIDLVLYSEELAPTPNKEIPLPIIIAVEHECNRRTFRQEIKKLLSVRCLLKVGITYIGNEGFKTNGILSEIRGEIMSLRQQADGPIGEDPKAEYLFLVGVDVEKEGPAPWHALQFRASTPASDLPYFTHVQ
jgi:hypothetical protein